MQTAARRGPAARRRAFQWRAWVTLVLLGAATWLAVSGVVLYLAPSGRVAKTVDWRLLWLAKEQWEALHTVFGFVFLALVGLHLKYNLRSILAYLRRRAAAAARVRREAAGATLVLLLVTLAAVYGWTPVRQVMAWSEGMNAVWERWGAERGFTVVSAEEAHAEAEGAGSGGYGRLSVADLAAQEGVPLEAALRRLAQAGVGAQPADNLLALSGRTGVAPGDLAAIVRGEPVGEGD
ncbi:hypothetical protein Ocepr_0087 [Oceanithermus profundus DSM 14977]|uniref:Flavinylation-associated cytochrome domain-containing protein n=1 Tax=Oceanithermus profundus (strain DSM 14977 / NBRC 100410 / VKM B-2274 / 506) TaxID=670487 RepID=E4U6D1_OCEP5|nr:DUF4405 domain-containing protein [Oceanithermus profundus]ADR35551.1 hypothetical protein Ocepr_0087 [Oceanithermus profundus DSM 14977]